MSLPGWECRERSLLGPVLPKVPPAWVFHWKPLDFLRYFVVARRAFPGCPALLVPAALPTTAPEGPWHSSWQTLSSSLLVAWGVSSAGDGDIPVKPVLSHPSCWVFQSKRLGWAPWSELSDPHMKEGIFRTFVLCLSWFVSFLLGNLRCTLRSVRLSQVPLQAGALLLRNAEYSSAAPAPGCP